VVGGGGMRERELGYMLVEPGASKLEPMLSGRKAQNYEAEHCCRGGAQSLPAQSMLVAARLRLDARPGNTYELNFTEE